VALHEDDAASVAIVEQLGERLPVEWVGVPDRRVVPIMQAGVRSATGDVVAMTDDDAAPHPDWVARLLEHYASAEVGGVGGRDVMREAGRLYEGGRSDRVGIVQWFGRVIGQHHAGTGPPRDVDVLKGVNMSLRRELWRLDGSLRGKGMQLHWELELCLHARHDGWRLVYDPQILVDHDRAPRVEEDPRLELTSDSVADWTHNELYAVIRWSPMWRRAAALAYAFLVGQRYAPGPLLVPERLARERSLRAVLRRAAAAMRGRALAVRSYVAIRPRSRP
jgi:GT2 family glycosyltransferase